MDRTTGSTSFTVVAIEGSIIRKKKIKGGDWIVVTVLAQNVTKETKKQNDINESWNERKRHQKQQQQHKFYNVHINKSMIIEEGSNQNGKDNNKNNSAINLSKTATVDDSVCTTNASILDVNCNTTYEGVKSQNSHRIDTIPSCCLFLQSIVQVCGYIGVDEHHLLYSNEIQQPDQINQAEESNEITQKLMDSNTAAVDPIVKVYAESVQLLQCAPDPFAVRYIIENQLFSKEIYLQTRIPNLSSTLDDSNIQPQSQLQQQQHHQQQEEEQQRNIQNTELYWLRALFPESCTMYQDQLKLFEKDIIEQNIKRKKDINPMTTIALSNIMDETGIDFTAPHNSEKNKAHSTETIQVYERLYRYLLKNILMIDPSRLRQQRLVIAKIVRGIQNLPTCHNSIKKQPRQQQIELSPLHPPKPDETEMLSTTTSDTNDDNEYNKDDLYSYVHDQHHKPKLRNGKPRARLPRLTPKDLQQFELLEHIVGNVVSKSKICFRLTTADPSDHNQEMSGIMQLGSRTHPDGHIDIGDNSHPQKKSKSHFDMDHTAQDITHKQDGSNLRALHNVLNLPGMQNNNVNKNAFMNCHSAGSDDEHFVLSDSNPIMSTRGTLSRREYLLDKKHPQIEWIVRRVKTLFSQLSTTSNPKRIDKQAQHHDHYQSILVANGQNDTFLLNQKKPNHILDVGGGRGDLAVALQLEFPSIHVTIIDTNQQSLDAARIYAKMMKCNLEHFHFICIDFYDYVVASKKTSKNASTDCTVVEDQQYQRRPTTIPPIDFVVALHACGDLSDLALFHAQQILQCPFIICPCCYTKQYIARRSLQGTATTTTSLQCLQEISDGVNDNCMESPFSAPWRRLLDDLSVSTADSERNLSSNMTISGQTSNVQLKGNLEQANVVDQYPHNTITVPTVVNKVSLRNESGTKEWKSKKHQFFNQVLLGKLAELNERPLICQRAMTTINSLRLHCVILPDTTYCTAVNNKFLISSPERGLDVPSLSSKRTNYEVSLEEYDSSLSRRNQVLVGIPSVY